jgi:hypothetical protein
VTTSRFDTTDQPHRRLKAVQARSSHSAFSQPDALAPITRHSGTFSLKGVTWPSVPPKCSGQSTEARHNAGYGRRLGWLSRAVLDPSVRCRKLGSAATGNERHIEEARLVRKAEFIFRGSMVSRTAFNRART